jgi:hypothetical protein
VSAPQGIFVRYQLLDAALVAAGWHATSAWWAAQVARFFGSARRRWIIRAGRRAGKSSTLCRLAVVVALWGGWSVPPGDIAVIPFVSVDRDEASARLRTISEILRALDIEFNERTDEIELRDRRLVFRVVTCSVRGTVGFTSVAVFGDEMARWESRDAAANPAREVMASLRPTMATQPTAFEVCSSSPWGTDDYHAELFEQGDTDHQVVSFAPTWVANPTISEARTHELEPDERIWSREYAAEPGEALTVALDSADLAACFGCTPAGALGGGFVAIDASSLRNDAFTYIGGQSTDDGELVVGEANGWESDQLREVSMHDIVRDISLAAGRWGTSGVFGDQREEASLRALFSEHEISLTSYAWSESSKDEAVMALRRLMRERKLFLPLHQKLRSELATMKARLMPSGRVRYETNGLDYASALITLMHAFVAGEVQSGRSYFYEDEVNEQLAEAASESRWSGMPGRGFG